MSGSAYRKRPRSDVGPGRKKPAKHGGGEMTERLSHQILEQARLQRKEVENEERQGEGRRRRTDITSTGGDDDNVDGRELLTWEENDDSSNSESSDGDEGEDHYPSGDNSESETLILQEGDYVEARGLTEDEEAKIAQFMRAPVFQRRTFADLIIQKIKEKEEMVTMDEGGRVDNDNNNEFETAEISAASNLPEKVVEVYTKIGAMLKHYTAGKLPKAFKIIPSLINWEEVLALTDPDEWTPHAVYAATRIFASNLNPQMAQRYYNDVLLERCRGDISANRSLNYHLYQSLCKAVYKPAAFFKGILLPLAAVGNCTLQEGTIFASVLACVSIPGNHSAVALLKLAAMPYSGATSLFIRGSFQKIKIKPADTVLLNKKYAMPHRVIDQLVPNTVLPVLWHQSLLVFCQRYKGDITLKDKERLKELLKVHTHHLMSDEARRELFSNSSRGEKKRNIVPCHR